MLTPSTPWGTGNTKHFFNLTPEIILQAVERTGIRCTGRCLTLNSMENRVYEVERDLDDPSAVKTPSDRFVVVKFYRPGRWSKTQIQQEHGFLADLIDADIPVVAPLPDENGETVHDFKELDLYYCVFPKVGGRSPDELDDEMSERIGRLLARMHGIGSIKDAPDRIRLTPQSYGLDNLKWLIDSKTLPEEHRPRYQRAVEMICQISAPWFAAAKMQRIHGDCHLGNLLWGSYGPFWVDFDDMVIGPPVQDIWLMIPGRDDWAQQKMRAVLKGYEMMRPLDRSTLRLIEPLRALRFVHFAAWIGKRWDDPSFPKGFPNYGTTRWWQEQIRDLEEQLAVTQENPWSQ
ncbi:MAG: serine/threonine protein kinase [Proteobacteria bacterium]|nr:serine/threonine protein kinase [Pseudomonadota bacterium]